MVGPEMRKVSIIVPVYYNEPSLPLLFTRLQEVERQLQAQGLDLELVFVDDGSGDGSLDELLKIRQQRPATRVIKLARNFGAVRAAKTGAQFVTGDCFGFLAADLQDPPEMIVQMAGLWQAGSKFVICVRAHRDDPVLSRLFSSLYYRLVRLYVARGFPDGGYDLALMDSAMLPYLLRSGKTIYLPVFLYSLGFKPTVMTYERQKRPFGRSRWTFGKRLAAALDVLLGFSIIPIRVISVTGVFVALCSFGYGLIVVVNTLLSGSIVPGFATLVDLISFLLGLVIIMLGVIGEYLWRIFEEVNARPEAVIEEVY